MTRRKRGTTRKTTRTWRKTMRRRGAGSILTPYYNAMRDHYNWMLRMVVEKQQEYRQVYESMIITLDKHLRKTPKNVEIRAALRSSIEMKIKEIEAFGEKFRSDTIEVLETLQEIPMNMIQAHPGRNTNQFSHQLSDIMAGISNEMERFNMVVVEQYTNAFKRLLISLEEYNSATKEYTRMYPPA